MKAQLSSICLTVCLLSALATGCSKGYRKLLNDEVAHPDGSTSTGTLILADSSGIVLQRADLSKAAVAWQDIDTLRSVGYRTPMLAGGLGIFSTPYYSAFQGEVYQPTGLGLHLRVGKASFNRTFKYVALTLAAGKPYGATRLGLGVQRHLKFGYVDAWSPYLGVEASLMFIRNNNTPQVAFEPFIGGDARLTPQLRAYGRLGFQLNPVAQANSLGVNLTAGVTWQTRHFERHYSHILRQHTLPRRFNP